MSGFFAAERPIINGGTMAEYRKGEDEVQKEPSQTKAGEEKGMLPAKKHFKEGHKKDGKKHSRKSSRR